MNPCGCLGVSVLLEKKLIWIVVVVIPCSNPEFDPLENVSNVQLKTTPI
jgi:hypothetical protein